MSSCGPNTPPTPLENRHGRGTGGLDTATGDNSTDHYRGDGDSDGELGETCLRCATRLTLKELGKSPAIYIYGSAGLLPPSTLPYRGDSQMLHI